MGNSHADFLREIIATQIGFISSGALRKDLPKGEVPLADLMDSFPLQNEVVILEMSGAQLISVLEQSLSIEPGLLQVSGIRVEYDLSKAIGMRVAAVQVGDKLIDPKKTYKVGTIEILAQPGDLFHGFA